ncbi:amino acid adenylation domain-containing protein [Pseudomonas sp. PSKL.D1]|uniref:amino acid adenylation domain-containing protein n=1 Tax=Pseudomonas sp. PSKL.D1 TaxID=3029060 RepID=UPI002381120F|nr:amino acid adenylation domain-containing protein [Pseudomonas sp. PSKL.D1]WDY60145.1 amino acid adenylation domain-containing protein [Pseudomonas sp. PSKL.D1]
MSDLRPKPCLPLKYQTSRLIFSDFLLQAADAPDALAVNAPDVRCSYGQLEAISRGIAATLLGHGAKPSDRVVIVASRCAGLVYAMLGALRAGLVFTVADTAYPPARIAQILDTLEPVWVLLCGDAQADTPLPTLRVPEAPDAALGQFSGKGATLPDISPEQPAYVTFTSGSTGVPKGVVTHHAPLVHFVEWHVKRHGFTSNDHFSLLSGLGHDPVYRDIFTPLSIGASVFCPLQSTVVNPSQLAGWIHHHGISVMHLTPPLGKLIASGASAGQRVLASLRWMFWGGDVLSPLLYEQMCSVAPNAGHVVFYGTTETPQAMGFHQLAVATGKVPLGQGIEGAQLLVVGDGGQLADAGEAGEILIRSPYLSLGYWRDPVLTAQKFVINPFTAVEGDRCYRTGDLGVYLADGCVEFLGRADCQVKIRGHRIELGEVEHAVAALAQVAQCAVLAAPDGATPKLVAFCVLHSPLTPGQLRDAVAQQLPDYMVPAQCLFIDAVPLTPNGKVDRRALLAMLDSPAEGDEALAPLTRQLADQWAQILQVSRIDTNLNFIELGGDSLSYVQASLVLQELLGQLPPRWETIPVNALAAWRISDPAKAPALQAMEMPVFMRMAAILLIVLGHFGLLTQGLVMGETTALFLVSGIGLARFQVNAIHERGNARSLLRSMAAIAVPTLLYTVLLQLLFDRVRWQSLLLVSNWFPASEVGHFHYWYIEVLVQMLLIIGLALSFRRVREVLAADPFHSLLLTACALLVVDALLSLFVFDATHLYNRVPQHYLAAMVLGMAVHHAGSTSRKWLASAVAVLMIGELQAIGTAGHDWHQWLADVHIDIALPAALALIWFKSVPLPGAIARGGAVIASSTLFIYLTHYQFQSVAKRISDQPGVAVVLALLGGIVVGYCWNTVARLALAGWGRAWRKRPLKARAVQG